MDPLRVSAKHLPDTDPELLQRFAVVQPAAVRRMVEVLSTHRELVTLYAADDHSTFLLTQIIAVGDKGLVVDMTTDGGRAERFRPGGRCIAICLPLNLKVQFEMEIVALDRTERSSTLRCAMPAVLFRIQRREAFRVAPPPGYGAALVIRTGDGGERRIELSDVSATGLGFSSPADETWIPGQVIEHARLYLGHYAPLPCTLVVATVFPEAAAPGGAGRMRVGCAFRHLSGEVSRDLQRFVTDVERAQRLLPPL